jgi:transposase
MVGDSTAVAEQAARGVPRADDRCVLKGIFWLLRRGRRGPTSRTLRAVYDLVNRFNRWRRADVWDRILEAVSKAYDSDIKMIDASSIHVHHHAANTKKDD